MGKPLDGRQVIDFVVRRINMYSNFPIEESGQYEHTITASLDLVLDTGEVVQVTPEPTTLITQDPLTNEMFLTYLTKDYMVHLDEWRDHYIGSQP